MIRILIVDDHEMLRDAISMTLRRLGADCQIFGVSSGEQVRVWIETHGQPDLVLLDVELPGANGIAVLKMLKQRHHGLKVAMLSGRDDPGTIQEALNAGAIGFIGKTSGTDALLVKVRELLRGVRIISSSTSGWTPRGTSGNHDHGLTTMQLAVLEHLVGGLKNREIAEKMKLAEGTVKAHTNAIYKALNVNSRAQLMVWARQHAR